MNNSLMQHGPLLTQIKGRIQQAQIKAITAANRELLLLYWDIGEIMVNR